MLFVQPLHPVVLHCTINQSSSERNGVERCAPCGLRGCKNRPAPISWPVAVIVDLTRFCLSLVLTMLFNVLLFVRASFYISLICVSMCPVFWLFWLNHQLLSDWLERPHDEA